MNILHLEIKGDSRGSLIAIESNKDIPFDIKRIYYIFDTKLGVVRGHHAHKTLKQMLICVSGSCTIVLDDGEKRSEVVLSDPSTGLYIGANIWHEMKDFSEGAVLLVLAIDFYNENDYIRNYDEFIHYTRSIHRKG